MFLACASGPFHSFLLVADVVRIHGSLGPNLGVLVNKLVLTPCLILLLDGLTDILSDPWLTPGILHPTSRRYDQPG